MHITCNDLVKEQLLPYVKRLDAAPGSRIEPYVVAQTAPPPRTDCPPPRIEFPFGKNGPVFD